MIIFETYSYAVESSFREATKNKTIIAYEKVYESCL